MKKRNDWDKKNRKSSTVQSVVLTIDKFDGIKDAEKWIKKNGFNGKKVDMTENLYRFRQLPPTKFKPKSFRTKKLSNRVSIVVGIPK
jgi:hypothetical protein